MNPNVRKRQRIRVVLNMVMAFVIAILLGQLWLFTVMLDTMEVQGASSNVLIAGLSCSLLGSGTVWALIRLFLHAEEHQ